MAAVGPHFWIPFWISFLDPIFGIQFWSPFLKMLKIGLRRAPAPIWAPGHIKCQRKTVLERPFWGAPQHQGPHFRTRVWTPFRPPFFTSRWPPFWTPCWSPFLDPILDPIFENCLRRAPGPIWAPSCRKCQSKTVLERPFWGPLPNWEIGEI